MRRGDDAGGPRSVGFATLVVAGYALLIPGQLATVYLDEAVIAVAMHGGELGRWLLNRTYPGFPPGAFLAVSSMLIGCGLIALAIGMKGPRPQPPAPFLQAQALPAGASPWQWPVLVPVLLALALAAATLHICRRPEPSNIAVATWGVSFLSGLSACAWLDRCARARLVRPSVGRREVAAIGALSALSLIVVTHDLASYRWSGTPDETHFFGVAKAMAEGTAERFLLSERGVFEVHPVLSSAYQALFLVLLGSSGWAWRLSSAAALVAALPPLYLLARRLWNARVAAAATALFGTTPVAVGFAHLGYNNVQVYPVVTGSLAVFLWAYRCRSIAGHYLAGWLAGLGFYTYYPGRLALPLVVLLGCCLRGLPLLRRGRACTAGLFSGFALAVAPAAAHPLDTLARMFQFTSLTGGGSVRVRDLASAVELVASADVWTWVNQSFMSLIYSVYFIGPHHFQWPPVVDPISGPLVLVGLFLCLVQWRHGGSRFLALAFVISAIVVGGTSHYFRPPLTRLLFLAPFSALLAAVALDRFASAAALAARSHSLGRAFAIGSVAAAVAWGILSLQYNVRYRYHGYGDGTTAELVRLATQQPGDMRLVYVQREDTGMWSVDGVLDQYGMRERLSYFQGFTPQARQALETIEPPALVVLGLGSEVDTRAAEEILTRRFPQVLWRSSDAERSWNLRYADLR